MIASFGAQSGVAEKLKDLPSLMSLYWEQFHDLSHTLRGPQLMFHTFPKRPTSRIFKFGASVGFVFELHVDSTFNSKGSHILISTFFNPPLLATATKMCSLAVLNVTFPDGCTPTKFVCMCAWLRIPTIPTGSPSTWEFGKSHFLEFPFIQYFSSYICIH